MEKKKYIIPGTEAVSLNSEYIMLTASPGVGGGFNPDDEEIGAKENNMFDEDTADEW